VAIRIKPENKGKLHRAMGVKPGQKIPLSALMAKKARDQRNGNVRGEREDTFAINARSWGN
jgi:hypothetical protein